MYLMPFLNFILKLFTINKIDLRTLICFLVFVLYRKFELSYHV